MAKRVILHLAGEDPILAEIAALPDKTDNFITVRNPRKRDGKALHYLTDGATSFIFPLPRITFIEVFDEEEQSEEHGLIAFFREETLPRRR
jgi:hypothetical protein